MESHKKRIKKSKEVDLTKPILWNGKEYFFTLILDDAENSVNSNDHSVFNSVLELRKRGILDSQRDLKVGDYLWVLSRKNVENESKEVEEIVVNAMIERKRWDDLSKSHRDGRFGSQKYRMLNKTPITRLIYLVEGHRHLLWREGMPSLPIEVLRMDIETTRTKDGFLLIRTASIQKTVDWLIHFSRLLFQKVLENPEKELRFDFQKFKEVGGIGKKMTLSFKDLQERANKGMDISQKQQFGNFLFFILFNL